MVLNDHDIAKCEYEGTIKGLLNEESYILRAPVPETESMPLALRNIIDARLASRGKLLVQSPFDRDLYEDASNALQRFSVAKHLLFSQVCMHLGAKTISVEQVNLRSEQGTSSLVFKAGNSPVVNAEVAAERAKLEKLLSVFSLRSEFKGGEVDIEAAQEVMRSNGLWGDSNMHALCEMRKNKRNLIKQHRVAMSLSRDVITNLAVAARLDVPRYLGISAEIDDACRRTDEYSIEAAVFF